MLDIDLNLSYCCITNLATSIPHFLRIKIGRVCSKTTGINSAQLPWVMVHKFSPWNRYQKSYTLVWSKTKSVSENKHVSELTGVSKVFPGFRLCERSHLIELGVNTWVFEASEMDTFAVNNTVWQLLREALLWLLWKTQRTNEVRHWMKAYIVFAMETIPRYMKPETYHKSVNWNI